MRYLRILAGVLTLAIHGHAPAHVLNRFWPEAQEFAPYPPG